MIIRWISSGNDLSQLHPQILREAVAELVRAYRRGHHLVTVGRGTADWLLEMGGFSEIETVTLRRMRQEFTIYGNAHKAASVYVDIKASTDPVVDKIGPAINVSVSVLSSSKYTDPTVLVIENIERDGWLYSFLMDSLRDIIGCGNVRMDLAHGGGADIGNVLSYQIGEKRLAMAIVDSDRNSPISPKNEKLNALKTIIANSKCVTSSVFSPPCREVENIVPFAIVQQLPVAIGHPSNGVILSIGDHEKATKSSPYDRYWLYFDPKDGISSKSFIKRTKQDQQWITGKLSVAEVDVFDCKILGYGGRIIDQIKKDGRFISDLRSQVRSHAWREVFLSFVSEIIWAFCCNRVIGT